MSEHERIDKDGRRYMCCIERAAASAGADPDREERESIAAARAEDEAVDAAWRGRYFEEAGHQPDVLDRLMDLWQLPWSEERYGEAQILLNRIRAASAGADPEPPTRPCRHCDVPWLHEQEGYPLEAQGGSPHSEDDLDVTRLATALDNVDQNYERGWTPAHYARAIAAEYARLGVAPELERE